MKNSTYWFKSLCFFVCIIAGFLPAHSQLIPKSLNSSTGDLLGFLEYKPAEYDEDVNTKYPIIIFLHGIGERGNGTTQLQNVTCCGLPRIIKLGHKMRFTWNGKTETFLVLSPQCPEKYGMWPAVFITELIDYAKNNLRIDTNRIFLTGLSMGGGGTFRFISTAPENPQKLAAAATICSPCTFSNGDYVADAKLPLWSFHAADDNTALAYCTEAAITRINYANPEVKPLKTIWPTGGHIVWDRVYTDTSYKYDGVLNIYEWFLGQNKSLRPNKLPTANAGSDINITTAEAMTTLSAAASTDPDGHLVRYVWKKISGPSAGVITNAFGPNVSTTVTGLTVAGAYQYELSVVDDRAGFHKDTIIVNVAPGGTPPVNKPPVAKAGNDITITLPDNTATLNGSTSFDEDGSIVSYQWAKTAGPGATFSNPNSVSLSLSQLVEGVYTFTLTVTDNKGAQGNDQVTITVNKAPETPVNKPPVARAGNDIIVVLPNNTTTLDGGASSDEDGSIASYAWSKLSGPAQFKIADPNAARTELSLLTEGVYVFRLTVTDDKGASHQDVIDVHVKAAPPPPNKAPVARAGSDISITLPVNTVEIDGSASSDEDGSIVYYAWSKVSGPTLSIANSNAAKTTLNNLLEGAYSIKLTVRDDKGLESEDLLTIVVNPAPSPSNKNPVARAGNDIHLTLPENKTTIDGSASSDEDGTITTYLWTKLSGPAQYKLADPNAAKTELSQLVEGLYMFRLKVTDNKGATHQDVLDIYVKAPAAPANKPPVARAGNDIAITLPVNKVTLNGNSSSDEDGSINSYAWSKISGPSSFHIANPNAASTEVLNLIEGEYQFALRVTDDKGDIDMDTLKVTVNPAPAPVNHAPVAQAGSNKNITLPVNTVSLDGSSSSDQDGTIVKYTWSFVSGPSSWSIEQANNAIATAKGLVEGTYAFRLLVEDDMGALDADTMTVTVNSASVPPPPANKAPTARAGDDITITLPTDHITLDGSASTDTDGTIVSYQWSKLSGPVQYTIEQAGAASTEVQHLIEGTYQFRLEVKDNEGAVHADTIKLIVLPAPNMAPIADAGKDFQVSLPDPMIQLNGLASNDPDGEIVSYKWTRISGPGAITIINSNTSTPKVIGVSEGEYVFELLVTDANGATSTDRVKVTVISGTNEHPLAAAGPDQTIISPSTYALLNGGDSYDADGRLVSYTWKQLSGPSTALMFTPDEVITEVENLEIGEYIFELTVIDDKGSSSVDKVHIVVSSPGSNLRYEETVRIYPNPSRSSVNLQFNSDSTGKARIIIYSVNGVAVQSIIAEKPRFDFNKTLDVHHLKAGLYYVEIIVADKQKIVTKFIKQ